MVVAILGTKDCGSCVNKVGYISQYNKLTNVYYLSVIDKNTKLTHCYHYLIQTIGGMVIRVCNFFRRRSL